MRTIIFSTSGVEFYTVIFLLNEPILNSKYVHSILGFFLPIFLLMFHKHQIHLMEKNFKFSNLEKSYNCCQKSICRIFIFVHHMLQIHLIMKCRGIGNCKMLGYSVLPAESFQIKSNDT